MRTRETQNRMSHLAGGLGKADKWTEGICRPWCQRLETKCDSSVDWLRIDSSAQGDTRAGNNMKIAFFSL